MAVAAHFKDGIDRKKLQKIRRRFHNLQRERLRRIENELRPNQQNALKLLPLLFHINHPTLPGFVNTSTPAGVCDFKPSRELVRIARSFSRSFTYRNRGHLRYNIQGIYLMGSIGSVAHTNQSDFDIWLCHDPRLDAEERDALHTKAMRLEAWAEELGLEMHFFVMDADAFRRGDRATLSRESSGSTQRRLLLEEFYRTGILIAGRYPLWWLVPPEQEANYNEYASWLVERRFIDPCDCLDFGGLEQVSADEFFSAARWQLYKGIESPYKAVLKILLMEAYSREYPNINWLCRETKAAIYDGCTDLAELDPYVRLYRRLEQYLLDRNEPERLELARRCFYFKAEQSLSRLPARKKGDWKPALMLSLTREWGWGETELHTLDSRPHWKIDRVMDERNRLVRELTHSYRLLTGFAREHAEEFHVDPAELNLLGRKLYTALERRPGKIERINPGISRDLVEERLSLHLVSRQDGGSSWLLYRGAVNESAREYATPLKTCASLVEMLTWCHINQVASRGTVITLYPKTCPITLPEVNALLDALRELYPPGQKPPTPLNALANAPYALACTLFINVGQDPLKHLAKAGKQLTSDRCNPLSFGATHTNLLLNLEQLFTTSWGELLVARHKGKEGLLESACQYLQLALKRPADAPAPSIRARGFSSIRAGSIAQRVEQIYGDLSRAFGPQGNADSRYLIEIGDDFFLLQQNENAFSWFEVGGLEELLEELSHPLPRFRPYVVDPLTLRDSPLPAILRANRPERIQVFFHVARPYTDLYILDEQGALFSQRIFGASERHLLTQQQRFFDQLLDRRNLLNTDGDGQPPEPPSYHRLSKNKDGAWRMRKRRPPSGKIPPDYLELRLISEGADLARGNYSLVCREQEFSTVEHGDQLYAAVAARVQAWRASGQRYPLYLTGVELSGPAARPGGSTMEILQLKKRLETQLNQALADLNNSARSLSA